MLAVMHQSHDGMQTCMRLDSGECWDMFDAGQGLRQGCVLAPHLLNLLFTAVLLAPETSFPADAAIMGSMVQLQRRKETREEKGTSRTGKVDGLGGEGGGGGGAKLWGMLYGDDAGIVSPIIRRAREDDDGDRNCVRGVRAYSLRGENGGHGPAD